MIKFPSIEQFRNVIRTVKDATHWQGKDENGELIFGRTLPLPTINFTGTVKIHGTNASVVVTPTAIKYQSRNNEITPDQDNLGFAAWASQLNDIWLLLSDTIQEDYTNQPTVVFYGEWFGKGIQKGVAVSEVPRSFAIFAVKVDDTFIKLPEHIQANPQGIYNILQFGTYDISIDFNNPHKSQNRLIELTEAVENECPVGKFFGISGIGEGIVWSPTDPNFAYEQLVFKTKGEKHSVTKVKTLVPVDVEKLNSIDELVAALLTENRLNQGIEYLKEQHLPVADKSTGAFLKWVASDILKEESDTIEASGLGQKDVMKAINTAAKRWYFNKLSEDI